MPPQQVDTTPSKAQLKQQDAQLQKAQEDARKQAELQRKKDEEQARLLRHLAIDEGRSFTDLVRDLQSADSDERTVQRS